MAIKSSFKQQCPSCEAMVPIRDPKLIGRKIDCPKCKYRFVVEEPDEVEVEEVVRRPGQEGQIRRRRHHQQEAGQRQEAVNGKAAKPAARRAGDEDDEDDEDDQPKRKRAAAPAC